MTKRRMGLGKGLAPLLDAVEDVKPPRLVELPRIEKPVFGVLRTKGGSGESHAVAVLLGKLQQLNKTSLVVSQNHDNKISRYAGAAWQRGADYEGGHGHIFKKWRTFLNEDPDAFAASAFDAVVFTEGTSSSVSTRTLEEVAEVSELVALSVNLSVEDSFAPAEELAKFILETVPGLADRVFFFCWLARDKPTDDHQYTVLTAEQYLRACPLPGSTVMADPGISAEELLDRKLADSFTR